MNDALEAARRELREALASARRTLAELGDAAGPVLDPVDPAPFDPAPFDPGLEDPDDDA